MRFGDVKEEELRRHDGAGSDGYLAHIFRHAAKELFNEDVGEVTYRALRCVGLGRPLSVCLCGQHCLSGINSIIGPHPPQPAAGLRGEILFIEFTPVKIDRPLMCYSQN